MYTKRIASIVLPILVSFGAFNARADDKPADYSSGAVKIVTIMTDEATGVAAYNKENIRYAESQNLAHDVNIAELAKFFGCKTLIGQSFIEETLKFPVGTQDKDSVLANRQNVIRALVENPELKNQIEALLVQAQQEEQEVVKLLSEYFVNQSCPELLNLEIIKKQNPKLYPWFKAFTYSSKARTAGLAMNLATWPALLGFTVTFAGEAVACYSAGYPKDMVAILVLTAAYYGSINALQSYGLYKDYSTGSAKRVKLHALNQLIGIAEKFEAVCLDNGINNQFNISQIKDAQGVALIKELKHPRYQQKNSVLFALPLVHTFLYKLYENEKQLARLFACIAEMDAYNALATKIIESQQQKNRFCFVTFVNDSKPTINATSFWNVLVKDAVSNNLSENKHVILTGPNAGGKTTAIRALLQNIILGQSFGVAAAESFESSMFDVIHSYLNISDDLLGGLSLFASEIKRAQEILLKIKSLESDKKFFFALDELFTGTVAEDGEMCAYNFIKKIAEFKNVQFIYATHFGKLKQLGKDNQFCANYKVDAPTKGADGKLKYPFTLSKGASESAGVALDMAKEANLFA